DLRAFQKIPMMFGSAAKRTINNHVFALLNGKTKLADDKPIFHDKAGNIITGAVGAPNRASLSEGRKLMRGFMDPGGKTKLNLQAKYLVAGSAHETDTELILLSPGDTEDNKSAAVINPFRGKLTPVIDSTQDTYDEDAWFLFPDKTASDAIEVAFLDGIQTPYLEDMIDFDTDGIKYKCRIDFGCGAMSHRIVKNPGK
ncbi:MAG: hypothetical protein MI862_25455, partial [Desulfobacterales bacterium]|nr:hypothetical protein [Desulfobacterales bacterium]